MYPTSKFSTFNFAVLYDYLHNGKYLYFQTNIVHFAVIYGFVATLHGKDNNFTIFAIHAV